MRLVVTTGERPGPETWERACQVATRCGVVATRRRGALRHLLGEGGLAYVVGRDKDRLDDGRHSLFVHPGLLAARLHAGRQQPLIRAILGDRQAVQRVVDGTLGLAIDAMHLAGALDAEVVGVEASPAIYSLCEEGLARLARDGVAAAGGVRPVLGTARDVLAGLPTGSADAVFLAPMFARAAPAAPGWDLLRPLAHAAPLDADTLREALRVGGRVVVKLSPQDPVPALLAGCPRLRGSAVDYAILTEGDSLPSASAPPSPRGGGGGEGA